MYFVFYLSGLRWQSISYIKIKFNKNREDRAILLDFSDRKRSAITHWNSQLGSFLHALFRNVVYYCIRNFYPITYLLFFFFTGCQKDPQLRSCIYATMLCLETACSWTIYCIVFLRIFIIFKNNRQIYIFFTHFYTLHCTSASGFFMYCKISIFLFSNIFCW